MLLKQRAILSFMMILLIGISPAFASGLHVSDDNVMAEDCSECAEMCAEGIEGQSLKSLNQWVCQQCLKLCESKKFDQENSFKEYDVQPCPAKPVS